MIAVSFNANAPPSSKTLKGKRELIKIFRRTYYYKPKAKPSGKVLIEHIEQIYLDFLRYGYRFLTQQLRREGRLINHKKVRPK